MAEPLKQAKLIAADRKMERTSGTDEPTVKPGATSRTVAFDQTTVLASYTPTSSQSVDSTSGGPHAIIVDSSADISKPRDTSKADNIGMVRPQPSDETNPAEIEPAAISHMSARPSSLPDMPTEILSAIVSYLSNNKRSRDGLRSLRLASKQMKDIAEPELFSSKVLAFRNDAWESFTAVCDRDHLRVHVKHLTIDLSFYEPRLGVPSRYQQNLAYQLRSRFAKQPDEVSAKMAQESHRWFCEELGFQNILFSNDWLVFEVLNRLPELRSVDFANDNRISSPIQRAREAERGTTIVSRFVTLTWDDFPPMPIREDLLGYGLFGIFLKNVSLVNSHRGSNDKPSLAIERLHVEQCYLHHIALRMNPITWGRSKLAFENVKDVALSFDVTTHRITGRVTRAHDTFRSGRVYGLLESADDLESVSLRTNYDREDEYGNPGLHETENIWGTQIPVGQEASLPDTPALRLFLGRKHWPRLRNVSLSQLVFHEVELFEFILRHAQTLSEISCSYCHLMTGTWSSLVRSLSGQIPLVVTFDVHKCGDKVSEHVVPWSTKPSFQSHSFLKWNGLKHRLRKWHDPVSGDGDTSSDHGPLHDLE